MDPGTEVRQLCRERGRHCCYAATNQGMPGQPEAGRGKKGFFP